MRHGRKATGSCATAARQEYGRYGGGEAATRVAMRARKIEDEEHRRVRDKPGRATATICSRPFRCGG